MVYINEETQVIPTYVNYFGEKGVLSVLIKEGVTL